MEGEGGWEVKKIYDVARQANRIRRSSQNYKKQKKLNTSCYQAVSYLTHSIPSIYKQTRRQLNSLESRIRRNLLSSSEA